MLEISTPTLDVNQNDNWLAQKRKLEDEVLFWKNKAHALEWQLKEMKERMSKEKAMKPITSIAVSAPILVDFVSCSLIFEYYLFTYTE